MLPPHIIEWLRERERNRDQGQRPQPRLELPVPQAPAGPERSSEPEVERGVTVIELF